MIASGTACSPWAQMGYERVLGDNTLDVTLEEINMPFGEIAETSCRTMI